MDCDTLVVSYLIKEPRTALDVPTDVSLTYI